jgi:hypothetical protein
MGGLAGGNGGGIANQFNALKALSDAQQSEINDMSLLAGDNAAAIQALQAAVAALQ